MIAQYQILCSSEQARLAPSVAYKLYSWLLESLPEEIGDQLHIEQYNPFSQYLYYDRDSKQNVWIVNGFTLVIISYKTCLNLVLKM